MGLDPGRRFEGVLRIVVLTTPHQNRATYLYSGSSKSNLLWQHPPNMPCRSVFSFACRKCRVGYLCFYNHRSKGSYSALSPRRSTTFPHFSSFCFSSLLLPPSLLHVLDPVCSYLESCSVLGQARAVDYPSNTDIGLTFPQVYSVS